jgi:hypothetical protein
MAGTAPLLTLVKARCDEKGWTFEQAAKRAKISVPGLRKLCSGLVDDPRGPTVRGVATMLGIDTASVRAAIEASRAAAEK